MNDEYVEEIHKIRKSIYAETKDMAPEELDNYYRVASEQFERRIAECRARKAAEKQAGQQKLVAR